MTITKCRPASASVRPESRNACQYARRWLSVSTVEPDLLATTTTVSLKPVDERGGHLARVGRVQYGQRPAERTGDDLGRQRRAAHPGEYHVRQVGQLAAQLGEDGQQLPAAPEGVHPAEPDLGLGLGGRTPEGRVLGHQQARYAGLDQRRPYVGRARHRSGAVNRQPRGGLNVVQQSRHFALSGSSTPPLVLASWLSTDRSSSSQLCSNFSTPSRSSVAVTSS